MKLRKYSRRVLLVSSALAMLTAPLGCGEDPSMYQGETLTFETPHSSKRSGEDKKVTELDLSENQKSDFGFFGYDAFPYVPWAPFPIFDYYDDPVPYAVPVSPGFAVLDYVHPFYAYAAFGPFWGDDDDGGHPFSDDDF